VPTGRACPPGGRAHREGVPTGRARTLDVAGLSARFSFFNWDFSSYSTVRCRYKRIVYNGIWVASLPFQSV